MGVRVLLIILFFVITAKGQTILYPQFHSITDSVRSISLTYENDFPNKTDEYYTQGISLNYDFSKRSKRGVLFQNTLAITHLAYTPQDISDNAIRMNDRPYTAAMFLQYSKAWINRSISHSQISLNLYLGILGPAAGGEWMQRTIHKAINSAAPQGWKYQIQNSFIVGPELSVSKKLLSASSFFRADALASGRLTTLKTQLSAGVSLQAGLLPNNKGQHIKSAWLQYAGLANAVGYDATLQGDVFGYNSPYTIRNKDISRLVFHHTIALNIWLGRLRLMTQVSQLTKEFKTGTTHTYSGLTVGYRL